MLGNVLLGGLQGHLLEVLLGTGEWSRRRRGWWLRGQVLVGVEAANCGQICNVGQLHESILLSVKTGHAVLALVLLLLVAPFRLGMSNFLRHGRQSDTFGQVWKRVNQSSLVFAMMEGAALTKLASLSLLPVLAGDSLVVRVDSSEGGLTEILGQGIVGLSELRGSMSELAVFFKAAGTMFHEMFAKLSLILLLKRIELALVAIKVVVVALLGEVSENLGWGIVEVARSTILVALIVSSFAFLMCNISRLGLLVNGKIQALSLNWRRSLGIIEALLAYEISILDRRGMFVDLFTKRTSSGGRWLYLIGDDVCLFLSISLVHHLNKFVK